MKILLLFFSVIVAFSASAQDIIYKPDGSKIEAKVVEVTSTEVKYKLFSNPDGPLYTIGKNELIMVVYQNGQHEVFAKTDLQILEELNTDNLKYNFGRNFIAYNLFDIVYYNVTFSYEHILSHGYVGLRVPFTFAFNKINDTGYENNRTIYSTGLDLNFYPSGQGRIKYFTGPSFQAGKREYYFYNIINGYTGPKSKKEGIFYALIINNGILFQPIRNMNIAVVFGLGLKQVESKNMPDNTERHAIFGINMGFKF